MVSCTVLESTIGSGARADAMAINITLNAFGTSLTEPTMRQADRRLLYPSIGHLYPEGTERLCFVGDEDELGNAVAPYKDYREIWDAYQSGETTIDDAFYQRDVRLGELAFEGQMSYACFYAYVKLKEQEIRNLMQQHERENQTEKAHMQAMLEELPPTGGGGRVLRSPPTG